MNTLNFCLPVTCFISRKGFLKCHNSIVNPNKLAELKTFEVISYFKLTHLKIKDPFSTKEENYNDNDKEIVLKLVHKRIAKSKHHK